MNKHATSYLLQCFVKGQIMALYPWVGTAIKLTDYDIPRIGKIINVGEDEIHAVLDVESRGYGFDNNGVIKLFEEHVFYRNLPVAKRDKAVSLGIANKSWRKHYKNNHETFLRAYEFDKIAAMKACSWGLGQILGENHLLAGFNTVTQMVAYFAVSEANQLEGMIKFIATANLDDELRSHDWAGFARGYNGKYYAKNNYDTRLAARYAFWRKKPDTKWAPEIAVKETKEAEVEKKFTPPGKSFISFLFDLLRKLLTRKA
jgi:hypothetical protein